MPNLTTADIAFLLITSAQQQKQPQTPTRPFNLTLETSYGLLLHLGPNNSLTASLSPSSSSSSNSDSETPTTPTPHNRLPFPFPKPVLKPTLTTIDSLLYLPCPLSTLNLAFPLPVKPPPPQRFKYRMQPDSHCASHIWYVPNWPGNPSPRGKRVREMDLEMRYSPEWFDAYLDWAERLEEAMQRRGKGWKGEGEGRRELLFRDEGERMLWMVEGLLLGWWLGLQEDVGGVEYKPGERTFVLEGDLGRVLRRVVAGGM